MMMRVQLQISGRVQGVGFRPTVYRLAKSLDLAGFVLNDTRGVIVELQGDKKSIIEFINRLQDQDKPRLASIKDINQTEITVVDTETDFEIHRSSSVGTALSEVSADMAACPDCIGELFDPDDFRYHYPFINCTNCGPRYSIVKTIPYDRPNTTMSNFKMCPTCGGQYRDVIDRRFHAQPVACGACGPQIQLTDPAGKVLETDTDTIVQTTAAMLKEGKILAIKGIGGFHLAVDALNNEAVKRLRRRKHRDHKPFAMMCSSIEQIRRYAHVDKVSAELLQSPQAPIVILKKRIPYPIAPDVAVGVDTFGFMLCYAPIHHLLFAEGLDVLVMTSGNISDEPLICDNVKAIEKLGGIADAFVMHNRDIYRQVDDSVVHLIDQQPVPLRRSRGYVPEPLTIGKKSDVDILALGGDLKNAFCLVKANQLILSEHIGDLDDAEVYRHYIRSIAHLQKLFEVEPKVVVCDLHPGYYSTQYARSLKDVKVIQVQHHWAHIASVMVEHEVEGPVIGLECDGTGYGTDGQVWGCECLIATFESFERVGHLEYYTLPGADRASKEPIRPLLSLMQKAFGPDFDISKFQWLLAKIEPDLEKQRIILQQIEQNLNTVQTSSLGRVFDAAAAVLGMGGYNHYEAQLPMALESAIDETTMENYDFELVEKNNEPFALNLDRMIAAMIDDLKNGVGSSRISAKFHNTLAAGLTVMAEKARQNSGLNTVALSGGVFCNRYLTHHLIKRLKNADFSVLLNRRVPANDGGLALGQAAIAVALCS